MLGAHDSMMEPNQNPPVDEAGKNDKNKSSVGDNAENSINDKRIINKDPLSVVAEAAEQHAKKSATSREKRAGGDANGDQQETSKPSPVTNKRKKCNGDENKDKYEDDGDGDHSFSDNRPTADKSSGPSLKPPPAASAPGVGAGAAPGANPKKKAPSSSKPKKKPEENLSLFEQDKKNRKRLFNRITAQRKRIRQRTELQNLKDSQARLTTVKKGLGVENDVLKSTIQMLKEQKENGQLIPQAIHAQYGPQFQQAHQTLIQTLLMGPVPDAAGIGNSNTVISNAAASGGGAASASVAGMPRFPQAPAMQQQQQFLSQQQASGALSGMVMPSGLMNPTGAANTNHMQVPQQQPPGLNPYLLLNVMWPSAAGQGQQAAEFQAQPQPQGATGFPNAALLPSMMQGNRNNSGLPAGFVQQTQQQQQQQQLMHQPQGQQQQMQQAQHALQSQQHHPQLLQLQSLFQQQQPHQTSTATATTAQSHQSRQQGPQGTLQQGQETAQQQQTYNGHNNNNTLAFLASLLGQEQNTGMEQPAMSSVTSIFQQPQLQQTLAPPVGQDQLQQMLQQALFLPQQQPQASSITTQSHSQSQPQPFPSLGSNQQPALATALSLLQQRSQQKQPASNAINASSNEGIITNPNLNISNTSINSEATRPSAWSSFAGQQEQVHQHLSTLGTVQQALAPTLGAGFGQSTETSAHFPAAGTNLPPSLEAALATLTNNLTTASVASTPAATTPTADQGNAFLAALMGIGVSGGRRNPTIASLTSGPSLSDTSTSAQSNPFGGQQQQNLQQHYQPPPQEQPAAAGLSNIPPQLASVLLQVIAQLSSFSGTGAAPPPAPPNPDLHI